MELDVRGLGIEVTAAIQDYVETRITPATQRFVNHIDRVTIRLDDTNGPKGGVCKMCKIVSDMVKGEHIIIEEVDADLYVAIDRATTRLKQVLGRHANKTPRSHTRPSRGKPYSAGDIPDQNLRDPNAHAS